MRPSATSRAAAAVRPAGSGRRAGPAARAALCGDSRPAVAACWSWRGFRLDGARPCGAGPRLAALGARGASPPPGARRL